MDDLPGSIYHMSASSRSIGGFLLYGLWFPLVLAAGAGAFTVSHISSQPHTYVSLAKLVAGPRMVVGASAVGYQDYLGDFYGTIIETMESREMSKRALERVRLLHPELKEAGVEVRVNRNKGSSIFNVAVIGTDREYSQVFLNSLLDEFKAFRDMNREQQRNKAVQTLAEDVVKADKNERQAADKLHAFETAKELAVAKIKQAEAAETLKALLSEQRKLQAVADTASAPEADKTAARQRLPVLERELADASRQVTEFDVLLAEDDHLREARQLAGNQHKEVFDLMHKFTVADDVQGDCVNVMERASKAVEDVKPVQIPMVMAAAGGLLGGMLLLLIGAIIWSATGPKPPPLHVGPSAATC